MRILISILIPALLICQISINEVMSNVKGRDSGILSPGDRNEFIELFNYSDSIIDLEGWIISDCNADDYITIFSDTADLLSAVTGTICIPPHAYAVIIDPEYTMYSDEYYMPYDFPDSCIILTVGNTTLGENGLSSTEALILMDNAGHIISTFGTPGIEDGFPYDPGDGVTFERISPLTDDDKANWKQCADSQYHTAGRVNSTYCSSSIMDTAFIDNDSLYIFFSYISPADDSITIQYEHIECILPVRGDTCILCLYNDIINIITDTDTVSILGDNAQGHIIMNEFYVRGSDREWIEIFNDFSIAFTGDLLITGASDTIVCNDICVPADSFIVICEDSSLLCFDFPYIEKGNLLYMHNVSLPDRQDTFFLIACGILTDNIIRGYEDGGDRSVERIGKGNDWGISVNPYGGTPLLSNSLILNSDDQFTCSLSDNIWDDDDPIITLNINHADNSAAVSIYIYSETGNLLRYAGDYTIASSASIPLQWTYWGLNTGMYIMSVSISTERNMVYKLLFYVR